MSRSLLSSGISLMSGIHFGDIEQILDPKFEKKKPELRQLIHPVPKSFELGVCLIRIAQLQQSFVCKSFPDFAFLQ